MMKLNSRETEYLLRVLRAAVKGEKAAAPPDDINWHAFFELSKKQEIFSMVSQSVDYKYLPPDIARELNDYSKSELVRLIAMQNELGSIKRELEANQIKYMLLKGSVIRNYYPRQSMRQMSDIDIMYGADKREILVGIMEGRGYKLMSFGGNSDDFTKSPYYTFEFHRELFKNEYGFFPDFSFVWSNALHVSNGFEYRMSAEDLYLHHIAHMYKHSMLGGFGIRFLTDTYLIAAKEQNSWNRDYINKKLDEFSLSGFEAQVRRIAFALIDGTALNEKDADFFNEKVGFGIYGNQRVGIELLYDEFRAKKGKKSVLSFAVYRLFPGMEFMKREYPVLNKKPYLLLFYYVLRILSKSRHSIQKAKLEIDTVKDITKEQNK